jgi:hypothetical protein
MNYRRGNANGINLNAISGKSPELWAEVEERAAALREDAREVIYLSHSCGGESRFHFGSRFNDNNSIAARAISGIVGDGHSFTTLSADLMDEYVIAAFIDAAGADHWYTFEKDYGTDE